MADLKKIIKMLSSLSEENDKTVANIAKSQKGIAQKTAVATNGKTMPKMKK